MVYADVELLEPGDEYDAASAAITAKYAGFGTESKALGGKKLPDAAKEHYAGRSAMLRLTPVERLVTWDNSRMRLTSP